MNEKQLNIIRGVLRWISSDRKHALYVKTLIRNLSDVITIDDTILTFLLDTIETAMDAHNWLSMEDLMAYWRDCCGIAITAVICNGEDAWFKVQPS